MIKKSKWKYALSVMLCFDIFLIYMLIFLSFP